MKSRHRKTANRTRPKQSEATADTSGLPNTAGERAILQERARQLATRPQAEVEEIAVQFIHFRLGSTEQYGIPYRFAEEILPLQNITLAPCVPAIFSGVTNRRGELLAVVDLKQLFGVTTRNDAAGKDPGILVVRGNGLTLGLLVDDILGNEEYLPSTLAAALPSEGFGNMEWIEGIHEGRITILDLDKLLADPGLNVNRDDTTG